MTELLNGTESLSSPPIRIKIITKKTVRENTMKNKHRTGTVIGNHDMTFVD